MKKIFLLLITSILAINLACAQTDWVTYKIDSKLSVKLPTQPSKLDEHTVYVKGNDSSIYIVALFDVLKMVGLDSAKIADLAPTSDFADSFKTGMLGKMPGSELGNVIIAKWKGYTCYNIEGGNASKKLKIYTFIVFVGTNFYSLMTILPENKSTQLKDDYFASLILN